MDIKFKILPHNWHLISEYSFLDSVLEHSCKILNDLNLLGIVS